MKDITNDQRLEYIELEVTAHTSNADGGVVSDDLSANHGNSLTLSGVNLTRHD